MQRRIKLSFYIMVVIIIALSLRTFYIQIICHEDLYKSAKSQYVIPINGADNKKVIYDRNMIRLTDYVKAYFYVISKSKKDDQLLDLINNAGGLQAGKKGSEYLLYQFADFDEEINEILVGKYKAYPFSSYARYTDNQRAVSLLKDIETMYNNDLSDGNSSLTIKGDGAGAPIRGEGLRENKSQTKRREAFRATLDASLQEKVEEILNNHHLKMSVVVLETKTGEVLTMANYPNTAANKAMCTEYKADSLFSLIKEASKVEYGGLSEEDFIQTATKLGFGKMVLDNYPNEKFGNISLIKENFLLTPIQCARMVNIVANNGIDREINLIKENTSNLLLDNQVISSKTAKYMKEKILEENGKATAWKIGFYPIEEPKYCIVTVNENGKSDLESGISVIEELYSYLKRL